MTRRVLLVTHPRRHDALDVVRVVAGRFGQAGVEVCLPHADAAAFGAVDLAPIVVVDDPHAARGCELVCVIGGDGSILRGAEVARGYGAPLIGINLGKVGFLAEVEVEADSLTATLERLVRHDYTVEERMTLDVTVSHGQRIDTRSWALNEVSIEKAARERMLEVTVEVDGRPLSTWGCDGVICATPTGSTAYAFSAGGPVVWPDVEAILLVPNSAHALFARPLVVGPTTRLAVEVIRDAEGHGIMWCDGRRHVDLQPGARIDIRRSDTPVRLARMSSSPFTDRLVEKFDLSVAGWRGNGSSRATGPRG
ncbi:MAG: NAD kinase [Dermatophilaceae bacterium]